MSLILDHLVYRYSPGTVHEVTALDDISLRIEDGEFIGLIGRTGSGKSTLVQHFNGLLKATSGALFFDRENIYQKTFDLRWLRTQVGMVFQYPEHQLFETTVFEDVKYGPKNQGLSDKEATLRAYEALDQVHFPKEAFDQSPFDLSGGQKRLAAIAGVLAMKPRVLILDEPTAGLDPRGRDEILEMIRRIHETSNRTIILVSHSMEDVAEYVGRIIVMSEGKILFDGAPREVFSHYEKLEEIGLAAPEVTYLLRDLKNAGFSVDTNVTTMDEATEQIRKALG